MAKNRYGFIQKRYIQPSYYRELFGLFNAIYITNGGEEIMVEAQVHPLHSGEMLGAQIDHYDVLLKTPTSRHMLRSGIQSQKQAVEYVQKLIEKY